MARKAKPLRLVIFLCLLQISLMVQLDDYTVMFHQVNTTLALRETLKQQIRYHQQQAFELQVKLHDLEEILQQMMQDWKRCEEDYNAAREDSNPV